MKVSQLKEACEVFISAHGDGDVLLCWEEDVLAEGFQRKLSEIPTDARIVPDWPLPGKSILFPHEDPDHNLVLLYGKYEEQE